MGATFDPGILKQVLQERSESVDGGVDVFLVGNPGCGKTNGLVRFAIENRNKFGDVPVWRGSQNCQWTMFDAYGEKIIFWLKDGLEYEIIDRNLQRRADLDDYVHKVKAWNNPRKLVERLDKKHINVVQTTPYTTINPSQHLQFCKDWQRVFNEMNLRTWNNPVTILFDELEDVVPEGQGKDFWNVELSLSGTIRSFRKNGISFFAAIHSVQEVHWRVSKKVRWFIYMQGAQTPGKSKLKVNTSALPPGWAFIEGPGGPGTFEKFKFKFKDREKRLRADIRVIGQDD